MTHSIQKCALALIAVATSTLLGISCSDDAGPGFSPTDEDAPEDAGGENTGGKGSEDDETEPEMPEPTKNYQWEVQVTTWRGDKKAAYTIFHDDLCNGFDHQLDLAAPALEERGLVASFGAIVQACENNDLWSELEALRAAGHEVASHSWSHATLTDDGANLDLQIDTARETLEANLENYQTTFFIFPLDRYNDSTVNHLRDAGYLGARTGSRGTNDATFDPFSINFDVYGPGYSSYAGRENSPCSSVESGTDVANVPADCRAYVLRQYVDDVVEREGYGIREFHSVDDEGWEPVSLADYETHLDDLVARQNAGDLWVGTASDVVRYRRSRDACADGEMLGGTLQFSTPTEECLKGATELTYRVTPLQEVSGLKVVQDGVTLAVTEASNGDYLVNVDPTKGDAEFTVP